MSTTNLISTIRFLSLATAALVTGPAATYAAMDPPKPNVSRRGLNPFLGAVPRITTLDLRGV